MDAERLGMIAVIVLLPFLFLAQTAWNLFCQPPEEKDDNEDSGIQIRWRGE